MIKGTDRESNRVRFQSCLVLLLKSQPLGNSKPPSQDFCQGLNDNVFSHSEGLAHRKLSVNGSSAINIIISSLPSHSSKPLVGGRKDRQSIRALAWGLLQPNPNHSVSALSPTASPPSWSHETSAHPSLLHRERLLSQQGGRAVPEALKAESDLAAHRSTPHVHRRTVSLGRFSIMSIEPGDKVSVSLICDLEVKPHRMACSN